MESVASQHLSAVSDAGRRCKVRGSPAEASPSPGWEHALIRWILDNRPVDYTGCLGLNVSFLLRKCLLHEFKCRQYCIRVKNSIKYAVFL
ncbi:hypothetical protein PO909_000499 [Leuciscus waleckii]